MTFKNNSTRFLLFSNAPIPEIRSAIDSIGAFDIIMRRHTNNIEVDFKITDRTAVSGLWSIGSLVEPSDNFEGRACRDILAECDRMIEEERYWEAHNMLEYLWKLYNGRAKAILHEVIGIAVANIKAQMGQGDVASVIYNRSKDKLSDFIGMGATLDFPPSFKYPVIFSALSVASIAGIEDCPSEYLSG
ncbi:MAG: DUF309 domain-containing protein [Thermoplasmataceae archaeon]